MLLLALQAMQWIADNVQHPAVVSASISGEYSAALDQAVQTLINEIGISVVAAAGESRNQLITTAVSISTPGMLVLQMDCWQLGALDFCQMLT